MPRPERPLDPQAGPVESFAADLRRLRHGAGSPTYRRLEHRAGYSRTSLSDAARGHRLASLPVVLAYVRACGGDPAPWAARWRRVAAELAESRGRPG